MAKIKKKEQRISKICTNCFKASHVVFNFAYVAYDKEFSNEVKSAFVDRIREVSSVKYLELMAWPKYKGFEEVKVSINKAIPLGFINDIEEFDGKYSIMRLYKNNIPTNGRIIGKLINRVFYVFYIDVKGILYIH